MYSSGEVKAQWRSALESASFPLANLSTPSWTDCASNLPPGAAERSFSQKAATQLTAGMATGVLSLPQIFLQFLIFSEEYLKMRFSHIIGNWNR
jgi:hypothetical protein